MPLTYFLPNSDVAWGCGAFCAVWLLQLGYQAVPALVWTCSLCWHTIQHEEPSSTYTSQKLYKSCLPQWMKTSESENQNRTCTFKLSPLWCWEGDYTSCSQPVSCILTSRKCPIQRSTVPDIGAVTLLEIMSLLVSPRIVPFSELGNFSPVSTRVRTIPVLDGQETSSHSGTIDLTGCCSHTQWPWGIMWPHINTRSHGWVTSCLYHSASTAITFRQSKALCDTQISISSHP